MIKSLRFCTFFLSEYNDGKKEGSNTSEVITRCKVCFKKLVIKEYFKVCCTCKQKVCEDCSASYGPKEAMAVEVS